MLVQAREIQEGPGPSEVVVEVPTADGRSEELIVDKRDVVDQSIEVGSSISKRNGHLLVELPREAMSGLWRVWIDASTVIEK